MSFQTLCPLFLLGLFIFVLLSFLNILYILSTSPLSDMRFANIFIRCVDGLFVLLTRYLANEILSTFSFREVIFFINFLMNIYSCFIESYLSNPKLERFSCFLRVLCFIFICFFYYDLF